MNIEIGEYVRTELGTIGKVVRINEIYFTIENNRGEIDVLYEGNQKHSKNIIDLIEIGDLIKYNSNNSGVDVIEEVLGTCKVDEDYDKGEGFVCTMLDDYIWSNDIKSIVTKEQFKKMEYKV